jgi:hypothetical protein
VNYLPIDCHTQIQDLRTKRQDLKEKVALFYQGLSKEQQADFIDLSNDKKRKRRDDDKEQPFKTPSKEKKPKKIESSSKKMTPGPDASSGTPQTPKSAKKKTLKTIDKDQQTLFGFFLPIKKKDVEVEPVLTGFETYFRPFSLKPNTIFAQPFRKEIDPDFADFLDLKSNEFVVSAFHDWRKSKGKVKARSINPRLVSMLDLKQEVWKLLQFHSDVRPPYYGTWSQKSHYVGPRKPFGQTEELDYDFDSELEWEEEEPGEELVSENEDEDDEKEDEEEDGFTVPHGYLSDDEGIKNYDDRTRER